MSVVARHRTAMARSELSRPLGVALADGVLSPQDRVFDYGCGRGDDLRHLRQLGYDAEGWDPAHHPHGRRQPADVVNLGYVINVVEGLSERRDVLRSAWALATSVLIVSSRLTWDARGLTGRRVGDGLITRTGTFQKFYEQSELAAWIEQTLGVQPMAAAPGIFYVFRLPSVAQAFLASRVHHYRPRLTIDPHALYEAHAESFAPLLAFMTDHARAPRPGELSEAAEAGLLGVVRGLTPAVRLINQVTSPSQWEEIARRRRSELLVYIALSRFRGRPRLAELDATLAADIRSLFGTYRAACHQADRLLFASGDPIRVFMTARSSKIGKQTPSALYVHRTALGRLSPVLQAYEGCAQILAGVVDNANMIKLSVEQPQVSYLSYPTFDRQAHPTLSSSVTVHLEKLSVTWRDYRESANPPLLHRKEEFLTLDDPRRELYERLTRAEVRAGLYTHPEAIGSLEGWRATLAASGHHVAGHRLKRVAT